MKFTTTILSAAVLSLALGVTAASAAGDDANFTSCLTMKKKVADALAANPSSDKVADATRESKNGQSFCNAGLYKMGVSHYAQALTLLGAS